MFFTLRTCIVIACLVLASWIPSNGQLSFRIDRKLISGSAKDSSFVIPLLISNSGPDILCYDLCPSVYAGSGGRSFDQEDWRNGGLMAFLYDKEGELFVPVSIPREYGKKYRIPRRTENCDYLILKKGETIEMLAFLDVGIYELPPGEYEVEIAYYVHFDAVFGTNKSFNQFKEKHNDLMFEGKVKSNRIKLILN